MIFTFEREPCRWVHPCNRRRTSFNPMADWDAILPALNAVGALGQMLDIFGLPSSASPLERKPEQKKASDKFELKLNVQNYKPEEIDVKMVDNFLVVEGKHEEKEDDKGYVSRHFTRRYQLPADVKPETVTCNLSSDGVLLLSAPRIIEVKPVAEEKTIPITFTGQPSLPKTAEAEGESRQASDPSTSAVEDQQDRPQ